MKSSCIRHPEREPLLIIRKWQVDFCEGNKCAAALMSYLEYWHNVKLDQAYKAKKLNSLPQIKHQDGPIKVDESLFQFHSAVELNEGIMGLFGEKKIKDSLDYLESVGLISIHRNPNKRYGYDKTKYFLFYPEVANQWLMESNPTTSTEGQTAETLNRSRKNTELYRKNTELYRKNTEPIAKITLETTKETSSSDGRFHNLFKFLKPEDKKLAIEESVDWYNNLPDFKQRKIMEPIKRAIKDRGIKNEKAYTRACLYNIMKADEDYSANLELNELEFVGKMNEFLETNGKDLLKSK